jgi:ABC-2 type transport system permease protein
VNGTNLRVFGVGGIIAYRGLFNWIRMRIYIPTMLGAPLFQIIFFTYLGKYAETGRSADFFIVGNAVQVCSMSAVYGMTMAIANERQFGTLGPLLASPASRIAIFLGRGVPVLANGLLVSAFGFIVGAALLGFRPGLGSLPALALVTVVTAASCTCFGMLLGSIGLRGKDFFFVANLAYYLLLLFCGINVPLSTLPEWMQAIGNCLPLTHGVAAARQVAAGGSLTSVATLTGTEAAIGVAYATAGFLMFRLLERSSRRAGAMDTF